MAVHNRNLNGWWVGRRAEYDASPSRQTSLCCWDFFTWMLFQKLDLENLNPFLPSCPMCVRARTSWYAWEVRGQSQVLDFPICLVWETVSCVHKASWPLGFQGIPLLPSISVGALWDCRHVLPCPFLCGFWGSELRSSHFTGKRLSTPPSPKL